MFISFGIPVGLIVIVIGEILFFATKHKKIARITVGIGVTIITLTAIVILSSNSQI